MIWEQIKPFREKRGLSQEALGERAGIHQNTIARWERGELDMKESSMEKLFDALQLSISVEDLVSGEGDGPSRPRIIEGSAMRREGERQSLHGLPYWGEVVERAHEAVERGKHLPLIAHMLREALKAVETACIDEEKRAIASPEPAGERSA
ncbi:MAG: helix-turn-helix transcriptional regulator [Synergistaceae bacterium]|nr:helix-turn-helix transcriptional regulator [Synergistaceae bacterium]